VISSSGLAPQEDGAGGWAARARTRRAFRRIASLLFFVTVSHAANLSVVPLSWNRSIGLSDLQFGAGTDFRSPVASDVVIAEMEISETGGANWSLRISRDSNAAPWPNGVIVEIKRSGGSGAGVINGGDGYQTLTDSAQELFSGTGDCNNVQILLRLDGVNVHTPPDFYSLQIRYEVLVTP